MVHPRQLWLSNIALLVVLVLLFVAFLPDTSFAAEGSEIFQKATRGILKRILPGSFGATVAMVAGILALVSAAVGSYRGAWALVFVCIACRLAESFVAILLPV